jgi:hypothetical protein
MFFPPVSRILISASWPMIDVAIRHFYYLPKPGKNRHFWRVIILLGAKSGKIKRHFWQVLCGKSAALRMSTPEIQ